MTAEHICTCLPAPFDEPCEGCKRNELIKLAEMLTPDASGNLSLIGNVTIDPDVAGTYVTGKPESWSGIDMASGPDRSVTMERDSEGRWHELTPSEAERALMDARRLDRQRITQTND